jgi:hypothetical protein
MSHVLFVQILQWTYQLTTNNSAMLFARLKVKMDGNINLLRYGEQVRLGSQYDFVANGPIVSSFTQLRFPFTS